jgi:hypothetical protein
MTKLIKIVPDALIVCGAAALACGVGMLNEAAGVIVAGILLIAGGVVAAVNSQRAKAGT